MAALNRTLMVMAGGTGGHVYPALAVADALRARGWEVFWLGTRAGLEARVVPAAGIDMVWVSMGGVRGKGVLKKLLLPATLWLLDEPYANLDRTGIALVNQLLETHAAAGGAALVTSHGAVGFHGGEPRHIRMHA